MRGMRSGVFVLFVGSLLLGCGGDEAGNSGEGGGGSSSSGSASREPLPDHNPNAKYDGKTALEYAEELSDLNPGVQTRALAKIHEFGVDGLPARDKLRAVVDSGANAEIKVMALAVLADMKAPGTQDLVRQKLADPRFSDNDEAYRGLLRGMKEMGVDEATLQSDLLAIHKSDPAHGIRIMKLRAVPGPVQDALSKAVFESDHDSSTVEYFMANLTNLGFLDDAQRVAYIKAHIPEASKQVNALKPVLLKIGDEAALEVTLDLMLRQGQGFPKQRYPVMIQFATAGSVDPAVVFDKIMAEVTAAQAQVLIEEMTSYLDLLVRNVVQVERAVVTEAINQELYAKTIDANTATERRRTLQKELPGPRSQAIVDKYVAAMAGLIAEGPTDAHKAIAVLRLASTVSQTLGMKATALAPAFAALVDPASAEIVRGTAQRDVANTARGMVVRDPEGLIQVTVDAMWKCKDAVGAQACEQILGQIARYPNHAEFALDVICKDLDNRLDTWGVNPIAAALMTIGGNTNQRANELKTKACVAFGKVVASKQADLGYLQRPMGSGRNRIMVYNTVDGMIGVFEPTVFAGHETVNHRFYPDQFASYLSIPNYFPAEVNTDAAAKERWRAFLKKVAESKDPKFSAAAKTGLEKLK